MSLRVRHLTEKENESEEVTPKRPKVKRTKKIRSTEEFCKTPLDLKAKSSKNSAKKFTVKQLKPFQTLPEINDIKQQSSFDDSDVEINVLEHHDEGDVAKENIGPKKSLRKAKRNRALKNLNHDVKVSETEEDEPKTSPQNIRKSLRLISKNKKQYHIIQSRTGSSSDENLPTATDSKVSVHENDTNDIHKSSNKKGNATNRKTKKGTKNSSLSELNESNRETQKSFDDTNGNKDNIKVMLKSISKESPPGEFDTSNFDNVINVDLSNITIRRKCNDSKSDISKSDQMLDCSRNELHPSLSPGNNSTFEIKNKSPLNNNFNKNSTDNLNDLSNIRFKSTSKRKSRSNLNLTDNVNSKDHLHPGTNLSLINKSNLLNNSISINSSNKDNTYELEEPTVPNTPCITTKHKKNNSPPTNTSTPFMSRRFSTNKSAMKSFENVQRSVHFNETVLPFKITPDKDSILTKNDSTYELIAEISAATSKNNSTYEIADTTDLNTNQSRDAKNGSPIKLQYSVCDKSTLPTIETRNSHIATESVLKKDRSVKFIDTCTKASPAKPSTKKTPGVKVPNFALIHKKAFEKMESLDDLLKRKEKRAKLLMSGQKPSASLSTSKSIAKSIPKVDMKIIKKDKPLKSKKQLQFAISQALKNKDIIVAKKDLKTKLQSPIKSTLKDVVKNEIKPQTPMKNLQKKIVNELQISKPQTPVKNIQKKFEVNLKKKFEVNTQKDVKTAGTAIPKINPQTPVRNIAKPILTGKAATPARNANKAAVKAKSPVKNVPKDALNNVTRQNNVKFALKTACTEDQKKAVANKMKNVKQNLEHRRDAIKGVRSNRRFELLMKMRNNK